MWVWRPKGIVSGTLMVHAGPQTKPTEWSSIVLALSEGKVVASGTTAELRDHPSPIVHQFVDGLADGPVPFHYPAADYHEQLLGGTVFA